MALLVYKFLLSGYPKYFEPLLKPRHSVYKSPFDCVLLEVPHFVSGYLSTKHFDHSFAYEGLKDLDSSA